MESFLSLVVIIILLIVLQFYKKGNVTIPGFFRGFDSPEIKGKMGEQSVASTLSYLTNEGYIIMNDLMFNHGTYTTQIDHIVISIYGIFIIETKNHSGSIFGNQYKDYWTQNIWGKKFSFYNPIYQNNQHIKFILRKFDVLKDKVNYIYPIVVFTGATRLQLHGPCNGVLTLDELINYIHSFSIKVLTSNESEFIASIFQTENIPSEAIRKVHINNVQRAINFHELKATKGIGPGICPQCGGKLIIRNGKYGSFYGCSNYPKCRYTWGW